MNRHFYAKIWPAGHGTVWASTGDNVVDVYKFATQRERDAAVDDYSPPSYCPSATMESISARDSDVRKAARTEFSIDMLDGMELAGEAIMEN